MQVSYPFLRSSMEKILGRIAVSEDARRTLTTHFGGDAVVIPNGVYVDRFASTLPRPQWQGQPGRPTIAFLGRMGEPRKGMPVLAAALPAVLAQVPGLRLLVAGPGDADEVRAAMTPEVAAATEFLGAVDDAAKAACCAGRRLHRTEHRWGEFPGSPHRGDERRGRRPRQRHPRLRAGARRGNGGGDVRQRGPGRSGPPTGPAAARRHRTRLPGGGRPSPCRPLRLVSRADAITLVYETVCEGAAAARSMPGHGVLGRLRRGGRSLP